MKATRMYKRRERRRAKRETTNGGMILNGEHVLTIGLVLVFVFSAPRGTASSQRAPSQT